MLSRIIGVLLIVAAVAYGERTTVETGGIEHAGSSSNYCSTLAMATQTACEPPIREQYQAAGLILLGLLISGIYLTFRPQKT